MIQLTEDGINCKQQLKYDSDLLWERSVSCPEPFTFPLGVYFCGTSSSHACVDGEIRNFKFKTAPYGDISKLSIQISENADQIANNEGDINELSTLISDNADQISENDGDISKLWQMSRNIHLVDVCNPCLRIHKFKTKKYA